MHLFSLIFICRLFFSFIVFIVVCCFCLIIGLAWVLVILFDGVRFGVADLLSFRWFWVVMMWFGGFLWFCFLSDFIVLWLVLLIYFGFVGFYLRIVVVDFELCLNLLVNLLMLNFVFYFSIVCFLCGLFKILGSFALFLCCIGTL